MTDAYRTLDLAAAAASVIADRREQDPDRTAGLTDREVMHQVRHDFAHLGRWGVLDVVDSWVAADVVEEGLADAYRAVLTADPGDLDAAV